MAALEERARTILPESVAAYYAAGADDGMSVGEASTAWDSWRLRPRVLADVSQVSTGIDLLGSSLSTPVLVAPSAAHRLAHPDGEAATARGAAAAGSLMTLSTRSTTRLATVAEVGAPWWMQVYVLRDRGITDEIARQAAAHGATALVLTGDTPVVGIKPAGPAPSLPIERLLPVLEQRGDDDALMQAADVTVADVARLGTVSGLPVLVKGVLRGDDARACADAGAAGVVVSNHGGRQFDGAVPTAVALPEVADALDGSGLAVVADGGIRSGRHVLTALAMGAQAVMLGRPVLWALAAGGADGVASLLGEVTAQTARALALAGCREVSDSSPDLLWHPVLHGRSV